MNSRPAVRLRLRQSQHLAGHRRRVPLAQCQKLEHVGERAPFGPAERRMWNPPGAIADCQQEGGDRVGNGRGSCIAAPDDRQSRRREPPASRGSPRSSESCTSRKRIRSPGSRWCDSRASATFASYSSFVPRSGRLAMMRTLHAQPRRRRTAPPAGPSRRPSTRSSVARNVRDTRDTTMMAPMKNVAIFRPSGRSTTFVVVVDSNTSVIASGGSQACRSRRAARVTATAAEVISMSTPVA